MFPPPKLKLIIRFNREPVKLPNKLTTVGLPGKKALRETKRLFGQLHRFKPPPAHYDQHQKVGNHHDQDLGLCIHKRFGFRLPKLKIK